MKARVRKIVCSVEEVLTEAGQPVQPPLRRAVAAAVILYEARRGE